MQRHNCTVLTIICALIIYSVVTVGDKWIRQSFCAKQEMGHKMVHNGFIRQAS